jgi:hypothetical protein
VPVDHTTSPTQDVRTNPKKSGNKAPARQAQRQSDLLDRQRPDHINLTKELEAFRQAPDKGEFSLKGYKLENEAEFVLGKIADAGRGALKTLDLSECELEESLDISQLRGTKLKALILRDTQAKKITGFEAVPTLKKIDFSNTTALKTPQASESIVDIGNYAGARNLEELSLANCGITAVTGLGKFKKHPHLKKIDLRGNPLSSIPNGYFLLAWRDIRFGTNAFSPIVKMEHLIGVRLNPGHSLQDNGETSSMLSTHQTFNAAEKHSKEVRQGIEKIANKNPNTANKLQANLGPHTEIQAISDQLDSLVTLFTRWDNPNLLGSKDQQRAATARYYRNAKTTAQTLLHGSIALKSVPERPDVQSAIGWNAVSKFSHYALQTSSTVASAVIPPAGHALSAIDKALGEYSKIKFDDMNEALSRVLKPDEIEPFCNAFSLGAALMRMTALGKKAYNIKASREQNPSEQNKLRRDGPASKAEALEEEKEAYVYTAKSILALAFGDAFGIKLRKFGVKLHEQEEEVKHELRRRTTDEKVELALRYFCSQQEIAYKSHLFVYRPSLNEQNTLAVRGITRTVIDIVNDSLESENRFEKELADRDTMIRKQGEELSKVKAMIQQQGEALKTERQKRIPERQILLQLNQALHELGAKLSYSSEEEDVLENALFEKMDVQMQQLLDSKTREQDLQREFVRIQNNLGRSLDDIKRSAKKGNAAAQYIFGAMNYKGIGVPENLEAAAALVSEADKQGYGEATGPCPAVCVN